MEFRHNQVLGFGKFLVYVQRLIFFFIKGKDPMELSLKPRFKRCGDSSKGVCWQGCVTVCRGKWTRVHT